MRDDDDDDMTMRIFSSRSVYLQTKQVWTIQVKKIVRDTRVQCVWLDRYGFYELIKTDLGMFHFLRSGGAKI